MSEQKYQLASNIPGLGIPNYAQPNRIALHMSTIKRIAALAGYHGAMSVVGYSGESVRSTPAIGGLPGGGVASAAIGLSATRTQPGEVTGAQEVPLHLRSNFTLRLNTTHIKDALPAGRASDPFAWAHAIDRTTASVLSRAAWDHLVHDKVSAYEMLTTGGLHVGAQGFAETEFMKSLAIAAGYSQTTSRLIALGAAILGVNGLIGIIAYDERRPVREACYALLPIKHPERAALAWAGTKVCTFASVKG